MMRQISTVTTFHDCDENDLDENDLDENDAPSRVSATAAA